MQKALVTAKDLRKNSLNNVSVVHAGLNRVLNALLRGDYSSNSRKALESDLRHFFGWYWQANGEPFSFGRVTERDVVEYKEGSKRQGLSVATINRRLITLKRFFAIAVEQNVIALERNPTRGVRTLRKQELAPRSLAPQEARRFLKEVELRGNIRDMAIVELMVGAGLRVSEIVQLEVADIEISERKGMVIVRNAKGGRTRRVPLRQSVRVVLWRFIEEQKPTGRLFHGQRGAISTHAISKLVAKYGRRAGVELSPHSLRHTFAFAFLAENPSDIVALGQILGHSNVNTTAIYTQNRLENLQQKVEKVMT